MDTSTLIAKGFVRRFDGSWGKPGRNDVDPLKALPSEVLVQDVKAEKALQDQIMDYLAVRGIYAGRQRMDRKSNMRLGWPDIVFAVEGQAVALEVKVGANQPTKEQTDVGQKMARNGWVWQVVRSIQDVQKVLAAVNEITTAQAQALIALRKGKP